MSEDIMGEMIDCSTVKEVWKILENIFQPRNFARFMLLKSKLKNMKKGNLSLKDYFAKIKNLVNSLAAAGHKISREDHIIHILAGLGENFKSTVSVISAQTETITLQNVYSLLLIQESRNERNMITPDGSLPSSNLTVEHQAQKETGNFSSESQRSNHQGNRGRGNQNNHSGGHSFRLNWNDNSKPQCQICGHFGRTAIRCYFRYDRCYQNGNNAPVQTNRSMSVMLLHQDLNIDTNWYPDSSAINHVTNDFNNLSVQSDYNGGNNIKVGNGAGHNDWRASHGKVHNVLL